MNIYIYIYVYVYISQYVMKAYDFKQQMSNEGIRNKSLALLQKEVCVQSALF